MYEQEENISFSYGMYPLIVLYPVHVSLSLAVLRGELAYLLKMAAEVEGRVSRPRLFSPFLPRHLATLLFPLAISLSPTGDALRSGPRPSSLLTRSRRPLFHLAPRARARPPAPLHDS